MRRRGRDNKIIPRWIERPITENSSGGDKDDGNNYLETRASIVVPTDSYHEN